MTRMPATTRPPYTRSVSAQSGRTHARVWHRSALGPPDSLDASGRARWYVRGVATAAVAAASAWSLILLASQLYGALGRSAPVCGGVRCAGCARGGDLSVPIALSAFRPPRAVPAGQPRADAVVDCDDRR